MTCDACWPEKKVRHEKVSNSELPKINSEIWKYWPEEQVRHEKVSNSEIWLYWPEEKVRHEKVRNSKWLEMNSEVWLLTWRLTLSKGPV